MLRTGFIRALKLLSLALPVLFVILFTQGRYDKNTAILTGFYLEEKDSLDVVLLGSSDVYTSFSSALAYSEQGFTSYPYTVEENKLKLYETQLREIETYQSPQLIVIELNAALYNDQKSQPTDVNLRRITDSMPLSKNRLDAVLSFGDRDKLINYFLPFIDYHGHPVYMSRCFDDILMRFRGTSLLKGEATETGIYSVKPYAPENPERRLPLSKTAEADYRELLKYCSDNVKAEVLFARFPFAVYSQEGERRYYMSHTACDIASEYGFETRNFNDLASLGINAPDDFYNQNHLNIYGQQKFTSCFSRIVTDELGVVPKQQSEKNKQRWNESAKQIKSLFSYADSLIKNGDTQKLYENPRVISALDSGSKN